MAAYIDVKSPVRSRSTLFRWYCNHTQTWKRKFWCGCIAADVCCCAIIAVVTALAALVGEPSARGMRFAAESATAAVPAALAEFGVGALPPPADAAPTR